MSLSYRGLLLIIMELALLGHLIEFIPLPVTLGFTSGIAITIGLCRTMSSLVYIRNTPGALSGQSGKAVLCPAHLYLRRDLSGDRDANCIDLLANCWAFTYRRICRRYCPA